MKSFLKPCQFPTVDHQALSGESANAYVKLHIIPQAISYQMEFHFNCMSHSYGWIKHFIYCIFNYQFLCWTLFLVFQGVVVFLVLAHAMWVRASTCIAFEYF